MTESNATPESWDQLDEIEDDSPAEPAEDVVAEESAEEPAGAVEAEAETEAAGGDPDPEADIDAGAAEAVSAEAESSSVGAETTVGDGPTETPDAPEETEPSPFTFRAYGQEFTIPDSQVVEEDGQRRVVMTEEAFQEHVQPRIQDPSAWERTRQKLERQVQELDPERNETVVWARTIKEVLDPLLKQAEKGETGPLFEWLDEAVKNSAVLQAQAERNVFKARAEAGETHRTEAELQAQLEEAIPVLKQGLHDNVSRLLEQDDFKGLGFTADEVRDELWEMFEAGVPLFIEVSEQNQAQYPGYAPGNYVNLELVQRHLAPMAKRLRADRERRKAAADAEKANNAALGKGQKKAPTTAPAKGGPPPEKAEPEPETYDDWVESLR